jgi:hypothetical protein
VVGDVGDAKKIGASRIPSGDFNGIDIKGIDTVKFTTLHALATGRSYDELMPGYEPVHSVSRDGPWVVVIPVELVSHLATLDLAAIRELGLRWADTDEFFVDQWTPADVVATLDEICEQAVKASSTHRSLFLWMCL